MLNPKQITGNLGEQLACEYLKLRGYKILSANYRCPLGEIDLIARERDTLVFVEVKTRSSLAMGHPFEAVTAPKQRQIRKAGQHYIKRFGLEDWPARFDVVSVLFSPACALPEIELVKNAFEV